MNYLFAVRICHFVNNHQFMALLRHVLFCTSIPYNDDIYAMVNAYLCMN